MRFFFLCFLLSGIAQSNRGLAWKKFVVEKGARQGKSNYRFGSNDGGQHDFHCVCPRIIEEESRRMRN